MAVGRQRFSRTWARLLGLAHFYLQQRCSPSLFAKVLYAASALHLTHAIFAQLQLASLHTSVQGLGATSYCNHCFGSTVQFYCAIAPLGPFPMLAQASTLSLRRLLFALRSMLLQLWQHLCPWRSVPAVRIRRAWWATYHLL
jgi:hypothetical protein